ncbi:Uncharacterised protein [Mycobacteroides abscessus subsp. abscessus]|nr:Uncharacterised protein [Mycobacteroides abscessus subsp. abscessus]
MRTVFTDTILLIILIRNTVKVIDWFHGLMKCGIKYCDFKCPRHHFAKDGDTVGFNRIVERSIITQSTNLRQNTIINDNWGGK